jgi:predicted flap endonuclease-1-like 5' DNA nuclease
VVWFVGQSLAVIAVAYVLGVATGWLVPRARKQATAAAPVVAAAAARDDRLERIEGIGPKFAGALRAAGIRTYEQLADAPDDAKRAALEAAGLSFAPSLVTWSAQARLLAEGDETAFAELTERLIAGRDVRVAAITESEAAAAPAEPLVTGVARISAARTSAARIPTPAPVAADDDAAQGADDAAAKGKGKKKNKSKNKNKVKSAAGTGDLTVPASDATPDASNPDAAAPDDLTPEPGDLTPAAAGDTPEKAGDKAVELAR